MKIEHLAIWVDDLGSMREFYQKYFNAQSGEKYHNPQKQFTSYFLSFENGCRLELMHRPNIISRLKEANLEEVGLAHFAITVGNKENVDSLTSQLEKAGYLVAGHPRTTGDGYYESVILDPEGNRIEITASH